MDAHYDMVMKARESADTGTTLYFGYSTILDRSAFEEWRSQHSYDFFDLPKGQVAAAQDVQLVYDFPSRWWGGRVAGLTSAPGQKVWGVLFEIAKKDWPIIQHKEGVVTGMCVEHAVKVQLGDKQVDAVAFVTDPTRASTDGAVSSRFVDALVRGATSAGLPAEWISSLKSPAV